VRGIGRALATLGTPVLLAVMLAIGTASISRPSGPKLVVLGAHVDGLFEGAGVTAGPAESEVVVRIVGDYECSACEALDLEVGERLREWARSGRLRYQLVQAPLKAHRRAPKAAAAFYCADEQGHAWEMHRALVAGRADWGWGPDPRQAFVRYARSLGLAQAPFLHCLDASETAIKGQRDRQAASTVGISSLPVILVGSTLVEPTRSFTEVLTYVEERLEAVS